MNVSKFDERLTTSEDPSLSPNRIGRRDTRRATMGHVTDMAIGLIPQAIINGRLVKIRMRGTARAFSIAEFPFPHSHFPDYLRRTSYNWDFCPKTVVDFIGSFLPFPRTFNGPSELLTGGPSKQPHAPPQYRELVICARHWGLTLRMSAISRSSSAMHQR